jgi:RNAse (barnase) inhibitor barstar
VSQKPLALLLRDVNRAGVHALAREGSGAFDAGDEQGIGRFRVSLAGIRNKKAFLDAMARALRFPDWFGRNWDALEDCLTDLSWHPAEIYVIVLTDADEFRMAAGEDYAMALRIFRAAADYWRGQGVPFWVFVDAQPDGIAPPPDPA